MKYFGLMSYFSTDAPARRPLWQTLLAPMLLASLGLHGLLLLIPVASSDEAAIPPPDPEQDNIAITRIPPAAADTTPSQALPAAAMVPQAVPQRSVQPVPQQRGSANVPASRQPTTARSAASPNVSRTPATLPTGTRQGNLPRLSSQREPARNSPTARVNPPNPGAPIAQPTVPSLGQDRRETILAYVASLNLPEDRLTQLSATIWQRYGYSTLNTSRGEYTDNLTQWQEDIQQETGLADLVAEEDRTDFDVEIKRRVCLVQPPGDIKIGFVANPNGSLQQDPVLLRSSGYEILDQKALERLGQYAPEQADSIKAYTVTVETAVDYGPNDCLSPP